MIRSQMANALWALSMIEVVRLIWLVRRWSDDNEPEIALSRMPLPEIFKAQVHAIWTLVFFFSAGLMSWMP